MSKQSCCLFHFGKVNVTQLPVRLCYYTVILILVSYKVQIQGLLLEILWRHQQMHTSAVFWVKLLLQHFGLEKTCFFPVTFSVVKSNANCRSLVKLKREILLGYSRLMMGHIPL